MSSGQSVGVFATTDQLGFGTGDSATQFTSNVIHHFGEGFHLEQPGSTLTVSASSNTVTDQSDGTAIPTGPAMNAKNNWWCCLAGPRGFACDTVTGNVDASMPALVPPACVSCTADADCDGTRPGPEAQKQRCG